LLPGLFDTHLKPLKDELTDIKLKQVVPPAPAAVTPPKPGEEKLPAEVLAQIHGQGKEIEKLNLALKERDQRTQDAEARAEKADKAAKLNAALGKQDLHGSDAYNAAFKIFEGEVKKDDEGNWTGPDGSPLDVYIDKQLSEKHTYFLKPRDVGGAGASGSGRRKESSIQYEDIKPGMTKEQRAAAYARVSELARQGF